MAFPPGKAAPFGKADGGAGPGAAPLAEEAGESESESASEEEESASEEESTSEDASPPDPKKKGDAPNPLMQWAASFKGK